jgi:hypothetical protein
MHPVKGRVQRGVMNCVMNLQVFIDPRNGWHAFVMHLEETSINFYRMATLNYRDIMR